MLPEIVEAVRGTGVEVYVDGGVRLGTDVLKALALGARAVFVGRPVIWGLAYKVPENIFLFMATNKCFVETCKKLFALLRCRNCIEISISSYILKFSSTFHFETKSDSHY